MKARLLAIIGFLFILPSAPYAQETENKEKRSDTTEVYNVNLWISGGAALGAALLAPWGREQTRRRKKPLTEDDILNLDPGKVPGIDRIALRQNINKKDQAGKVSDLIMQSIVWLPATLFLDREIRQDVLDITGMYLESQAFSALFHTFGPFGPTFVTRTRPQAYYTDLPTDQRNDREIQNSFYSGHVASTANATFFMAKVLSDYHPEWKAKKWIAYGLAAIPPAVVGVLRVQAVRHYPTDSIVGYIIGTATGILVPEIHRIKDGNLKVSVQYSSQMKGFALQYSF